MAEEVDESTVLTELIGIGWVIERSVVVARDDDESAAHFLFQRVAALNVNILAEHSLKLGLWDYESSLVVLFLL